VKCLNCGHVRTMADNKHTPPTECPGCGGLYAKMVPPRQVGPPLQIQAAAIPQAAPAMTRSESGAPAPTRPGSIAGKLLAWMVAGGIGAFLFGALVAICNPDGDTMNPRIAETVASRPTMPTAAVAGSAVGGSMITGALGFVGFFLGAFFLVIWLLSGRK